MPTSDNPLDLVVDRVRNGRDSTRVTRMSMAGAGDHHDFVLVGGVGVAASYFEFLAPTLAERGDVYALDLPGFAGMRRPETPPTIAFFADQVEAVLDHYGLDDPVIIGHSMGTQVVTEVLIRRPGIRLGVLVSPVINDREQSIPAQAIRFAQSALRENLHLAMSALSAYLLCGVVYFLTVLPYMMRYRLRERIALVSASVLLIRGEFDTTSPRGFLSRLSKAHGDAPAWEVEGAAHSVINGHAVGVADLTLRHLDGELGRMGRVPAAKGEVPEPLHRDIGLVLQALGSRVAEWVAALRRDDDGVARAKARHAQTLWRAYRGR